jgi:trimethylamine--corrinoid protein Co-methyltransferase
MKMEKIKVLSQEDIELIHSSTLQLLSSVGIKIDCEDVRKLFKDYGAEVDDESNFVKIPESLLKEHLKTVPDSFKLYGPDKSYNIEINTRSTHFATLGTPVKIYDPTKKSGVRKTVLDDTIQQIRIVDGLEHIIASHIDVWPNDVNYLTLHTTCMYQWVHNTRKPYGLGTLGKLPSQDMMEMASIVVGGKEELIKNPRLIGFMNPTSPLQLPKLMTNGFAVWNKYKQPVLIPPEALAGTSAPVTLAGLLTQCNAEVLGSVVLSQLNNPGAPVLYGSVSCVTDMRSGNSALGSIETGLITAGVAQLARYYNIPSRAVGGATESKVLDIQNGFERLQTMMLAVQAGINYITCAGTYESTLAESLELLVIDDELAGMVSRALEGVTVNEDTIGLDVIKKIATNTQKGSNFLGEKHTRKYMKKELYIPKLVDRNRRSTWRKRGAKDIIEKAQEKVEKILQEWIAPEISSDIEKRLLEYMDKVAKRTYEFYKKAEGISADRVSIVSGLEIKDESNK